MESINNNQELISKSNDISLDTYDDNILKCLLFKGELWKEVRPLFFYKWLGKDIVNARIVSLWACNFACPYCKRDWQFRDDDWSIISSVNVSIWDIKKVINDATQKWQIVRFSGWDPVAYPEEVLELARYISDKWNSFSIAHNWSSPIFVKKLLDYNLESAAIDLKATRNEINMRTWLNNGSGSRMYDNSLMTQKLLSSNWVLLDIRTPIFSSTTLDVLIELARDIVKTNGKNLNNVFWTLRIYKPVEWCDRKAPATKESIIWMIKEIKKIYPELNIWLRAKWEKWGFLYF